MNLAVNLGLTTETFLQSIQLDIAMFKTGSSQTAANARACDLSGCTTVQSSSRHHLMSQNKNTEEFHTKVKTKVVVRNLPYSLSEADLKKTLADFLPHIGYFYFVAGRLGKASSLEYAFVSVCFRPYFAFH
jgi:hypothetical protein